MEPIHETFLVRLTLPESGWSGELAALSEDARTTIPSLLAEDFPVEKMPMFLAALNRSFGCAVGMAQNSIVLSEECAALVKQTEWKKPAPKKLGVLLRDYIDNLRLVLEDAQNGRRKVAYNDFVRDIERFPVLKRLVSIQLEERLRFATTDPLRRTPELAAEHLSEVLDELYSAISDGILSGPVNGPMRFLSETFVRIFYSFTRRPPGRTWHNYRQLETGRGLETCRLLARELIENLPEEARPPEGFDMAKTYRKACEKLRQEIEQEASPTQEK